jgi:DNA-binding PadR family transcriptional regulator
MKGERLGEFEELTLLAVASLGEDAYGVAVQQRLEREMRSEVSLGAVYSALERMETKGFVTSSLGKATAARGGRRKRLFEVTPLGQRTLRDVRRTRESLWSAALDGWRRVSPRLRTRS